VDNRIAKGVDYIKIVRDNHSWMGRPPLPTLTYEQIGKIIEYAHSKGYLAVVHAVHADDFLEIAKYKPDGFVHMWDYKENSSLTDEQYQVIANSGAFIVPTSGISLKAKHMELPPFVKNFLDEEILSLEERTGIIKKLHDAGVMIVAGTDAQEGQMNFGEDYYFELEIYEKSGLSTIEVLRTATGNAGKAFKMPVGILSVGSKASFIILNNDPLENLKNVKEINQIWKNGVSE
jgi:imidazolonepropionase-like amidohydrolase